MLIVLPLARSVQSYLHRFANNPPGIRPRCPHCGASHMHAHGHYWRSVVERRRISRIPIYRWRCPQCGRTLSLLPDLLAPYARFLTLLRQKAVSRRLAGWSWERVALAVSSPDVSVVSVRTLLRWWRRFLRWVACRGSEPAGRFLEAAPAVAVDLLRPGGSAPEEVARFLWETGRALRQQVGRLPGAHPGLFSFLNSLLGGPAYL